jgi:L-lactate dehydrogenase complex protein LldE
VPLPGAEQCCGFGGTFAVKMPHISTAMVDEKVDHILETGADVLVGLDMSCLMNIDGRLRRRGRAMPVKHLAEILAEGWQA